MVKQDGISTLIPKKEWLKIGENIDPDNKDNIIKNTRYWFVELGELDSTIKKEQAKLKAFFSQKWMSIGHIMVGSQKNIFV